MRRHLMAVRSRSFRHCFSTKKGAPGAGAGSPARLRCSGPIRPVGPGRAASHVRRVHLPPPPLSLILSRAAAGRGWMI